MLKQRYVIFVVILAIILAFSYGSHFTHPIAAHAQKNLVKNTCKRNVSACLGSVVSSKPLITQAPTIPPGFCLHVPVFLYHHIQPEEIAKERGQTSLTVDNGVFENQMAYLAQRGYNTISAAALVAAIENHTPLAANTVVITIDDGYLDVYQYAYPILQKYHINASLMVPTGLLGNQIGTNQYYSWDQLKQMLGSGLITVYNHTWSHYALAAGPVSKDEYEISTAQQQLQEHIGAIQPIFVYPYGSGATTSWVISLLQKDGYKAAFSTLYGWYQCDSNIFSLPRIHVGNVPMSTFGL